MTVPTDNETHPVHTVALDLDDPLVFYIPSIEGPKTFLCFVPYLLLIHVGKFFLDHFSPCCMGVLVGMIPSFSESFGLFGYRLGVGGQYRQIDKKI